MQFSAGASGYPWTWAHLSDDEKVQISQKACAGKLQLIREATRLYGASTVLPFASHFALRHPSHRNYASLMKRNTLADVKATFADSDVDVVDLLPGDTWDVGRGVIRRAPASAEASAGKAAEAAPVAPEKFAAVYPSDESLSRDELVAHLLRLQRRSRSRLLRGRRRPHAGRRDRPWSFAFENGRLSLLDAPLDRPNLSMTMPLAVLTAVIREELSWDEAFIGYWCRFDRRPNVYHSGFWRLFQAPYFRRPLNVAEASATVIRPQSTMAEVLENHGDRADRILRRYGLYCLGCQHSTADSIEMATVHHGIDAKQRDALLKELNRAFHGETVD